MQLPVTLNTFAIPHTPFDRSYIAIIPYLAPDCKMQSIYFHGNFTSKQIMNKYYVRDKKNGKIEKKGRSKEDGKIRIRRNT